MKKKHFFCKIKIPQNIYTHTNVYLRIVEFHLRFKIHFFRFLDHAADSMETFLIKNCTGNFNWKNFIFHKNVHQIFTMILKISRQDKSKPGNSVNSRLKTNTCVTEGTIYHTLNINQKRTIKNSKWSNLHLGGYLIS